MVIHLYFMILDGRSPVQLAKSMSLVVWYYKIAINNYVLDRVVLPPMDTLYFPITIVQYKILSPILAVIVK